MVEVFEVCQMPSRWLPRQPVDPDIAYGEHIQGIY